jgi:hypothetical protein
MRKTQDGLLGWMFILLGAVMLLFALLFFVLAAHTAGTEPELVPVESFDLSTITGQSSFAAEVRNTGLGADATSATVFGAAVFLTTGSVSRIGVTASYFPRSHFHSVQ